MDKGKIAMTLEDLRVYAMNESLSSSKDRAKRGKMIVDLINVAEIAMDLVDSPVDFDKWNATEDLESALALVRT
jgi:hypothetical protein